MKPYFNSYSDYLKRKYGERIQKIGVNAGFTCPNRDGTKGFGGCSYCNNDSFISPLLKDLSLTEQIENGIRALKKRYKKVHKFFVYFQAYSNTYAPLAKLKSIYQEALAHPLVIGLAIGTRPDCIDEEKISYLEKLALNYEIVVEYGLESTCDQTLISINRGHDFNSFVDAVNLTSDRGIKICTHLIIGLPGEDRALWTESAKKLSNLPIDFIKLHQLHVVKGTCLADLYRQKSFPLLTMDQYIDIVINFLEHLSPEMVIQRLFGEAPEKILIAPHWELNHNQLRARLIERMKELNTYQGKNFNL